MSINSLQRRRHSIRLKGYDYSEPGNYFVAICTRNKECILGEVCSEEMKRSYLGDIATNWWMQIPTHFQCVNLDVFIVMPNHIHGIITIIDHSCRGDVSSPQEITLPQFKASIFNNDDKNQRGEGTRGEVTSPLRRITLGKIVAWYKYQSTKEINAVKNTPGGIFWQRNYYERIIRNEREFSHIHEYILTNPMRWKDDSENLGNH